MKKIILLTGASSGLGLHTSIALAKQNYKVYAAVRSPKRSTELLSVIKQNVQHINLLQLDVTDMSSIEHAVSHIIATEGKIDVLINNAGVGFRKSIEQANINEIQDILNINLLGTIRCCQAVLPHMRQAKNGHIINISSIGGLVGQPFNEIYCASKFAVEGLTESMASYIQPAFNIKFTLVEPGGMATSFFNTNQVDDNAVIDEYSELYKKYRANQQSRTRAFQSAEDVAKIIVNVIQDSEPPLRIRTSLNAEQICELKTLADPTGTILRDKIASRIKVNT